MLVLDAALSSGAPIGSGGNCRAVCTTETAAVTATDASYAQTRPREQRTPVAVKGSASGSETLAKQRPGSQNVARGCIGLRLGNVSFVCCQIRPLAIMIDNAYFGKVSGTTLYSNLRVLRVTYAYLMVFHVHEHRTSKHPNFQILHVPSATPSRTNFDSTCRGILLDWPTCLGKASGVLSM